MATIAAGSSVTGFVPNAQTITFTPGSGGRISFNGRNQDGSAITPREIYSETAIALASGATFSAEAIGNDGTYTDIQSPVSGGGGSWGNITGTLSAQTDLQAALDVKQTLLVSGLSLKTVGGASLLGSGDVPVGESPASGVVHVDTAGVTDTTGDITPALLAAFVAADVGGPIPNLVVCPPGKWRMATRLTVTDRPINFDGQGSEFVMATSQDAMQFINSSTAAYVAVTSVANRANYTYYGAAFSWGAEITMPDTTAYAVGAVVKVCSDNRINKIAFTADTGSVERWAEWGTVIAKDATRIWLDRCFEGEYANNPRIAVLNKERMFRAVNVGFVYTNPDYPENSNLGTFVSGMLIRGWVRPYVSNIIAHDLPGPCLSVESCYVPHIGTIRGYHQQGNTSNNQIGYTLQVSGSQGGSAEYIYGERVRHVFTTNAVDVAANNAALQNYGGCVDFHVETCVGESCESFVWDTHTDAYNVTGGRVVSRGDFQPRSEQMGAVQFRGIKCHVEHVHCESENGYGILWNTYAVDCTVGKVTGTMAYVCRGGPQKGAANEYSYARAYIGEVDVSVAYGTNVFRWSTFDGLCEVGDATIRFMPNEFTPQSTLSVTVFAWQPRTNYADARGKVGSLKLDMSMMTDAGQAVNVYIFGTTNTMDRVDVGRVTVDYGSGITDATGKVKLFSTAATVTNGWSIGEFECVQSSESADTFVPPIWQSGTTGQTVSIGRIAINGTANSRKEVGSGETLSFSSATQALTHAVQSGYILSGNTLKLLRNLSSVLTCTSPAAKITSLQAPARNGQVWKLACAAGSANPLVIASGQISNVGSDLSVAAANEITLTAVGGAWVKYTAA